MKPKLTGDEFVALVEESSATKLSHPQAVSSLYESSAQLDDLSGFGDLALYAKSFQKVSRLLSAGKANDETVSTAKGELESLMNKFLNVMRRLSDAVPTVKRDELSSAYLSPTPQSLENLQSLMIDFSKVKDYMLRQRDRSS